MPVLQSHKETTVPPLPPIPTEEMLFVGQLRTLLAEDYDKHEVYPFQEPTERFGAIIELDMEGFEGQIQTHMNALAEDISSELERKGVTQYKQLRARVAIDTNMQTKTVSFTYWL